MTETCDCSQNYTIINLYDTCCNKSIPIRKKPVLEATTPVEKEYAYIKINLKDKRRVIIPERIGENEILIQVDQEASKRMIAELYGLVEPAPAPKEEKSTELIKFDRKNKSIFRPACCQ